VQNLPSPDAAGVNNKQLDKKQNKGSKQRTGQNDGGVDGGDGIENLLIHDQKKSRNIDCSGIGLQFTLSTARRNSTLRQKQKNVKRNKVDNQFFHFYFHTFFLRVFSNIAPFFLQVKVLKKFFIFLFFRLDMMKNHGILESVLK